MKPAVRSDPDGLWFDGPLVKPSQWKRHVNGVSTEGELNSRCQSVARGTPFGNIGCQSETAKSLRPGVVAQTWRPPEKRKIECPVLRSPFCVRPVLRSPVLRSPFCVRGWASAPGRSVFLRWYGDTAPSASRVQLDNDSGPCRNRRCPVPDATWPGKIPRNSAVASRFLPGVQASVAAVRRDSRTGVVNAPGLARCDAESPLETSDLRNESPFMRSPEVRYRFRID